MLLLCITLMQIFTDWKGGEPADDRLQHDIVVDYLSKFSQAVTLYLEFLIFTMKMEVLFHVIIMTESMLALLLNVSDKAISKIGTG